MNIIPNLLGFHCSLVYTLILSIPCSSLQELQIFWNKILEASDLEGEVRFWESKMHRTDAEMHNCLHFSLHFETVEFTPITPLACALQEKNKCHKTLEAAPALEYPRLFNIKLNNPYGIKFDWGVGVT